MFRTETDEKGELGRRARERKGRRGRTKGNSLVSFNHSHAEERADPEEPPTRRPAESRKRAEGKKVSGEKRKERREEITQRTFEFVSLSSVIKRDRIR